MHPQFTPTPADIDRFWSHVNKNGPLIRPDLGPCWPWKLSRTKLGYGKFARGGNRGGWMFAQRAAYEITNGPLPSGFYALHRCDYPPCCRPDHLFAGTKADNSADMAAKGRSTKGDRNPTRLYPERVERGSQRYNAKLTESAVAEIRQLFATGTFTQIALAQQFDVTFQTIHLIVRNKTWRHVA